VSVEKSSVGESTVQVESRAEWRRWLEANHARSRGIWVVTFRKNTPDRHVPYEHIVEEALCFGWIDSLPRRLDERRTMLWLAPRQAGSGWSRPNKQRAERMIDAGMMTAAGLCKIQAAKADGSWNALDAVESLEIPEDLEAALASCGQAAANFDAFARSVKRGILEWIATARRAETRKKRVEETARLARDNLRANQWPGTISGPTSGPGTGAETNLPRAPVGVSGAAVACRWRARPLDRFPPSCRIPGLQFDY
jgi:uncharacterized protein YdeI (YjbR/CyaY-like superfamily)